MNTPLKNPAEKTNLPESAIERLSQLSDPYTQKSPEEEVLFQEAMEECHQWQKKTHRAYAQLAQTGAPMIPVALLKQLLTSESPSGIEGTSLSSSGTQGNPSHVYFDTESLQRIVKAQFHIFGRYGFPSRTPTCFLLLSPDPRAGSFPGYAYAFDKMTECAPSAEKIFAVDAQQHFDPERALQALKRYAQGTHPVYLFGLTAFFEQMILALKTPLSFKAPVKAITGGGWKGLLQTLTREEMVLRFQEKFQSPSTVIHNLYGMTEHPLHYLSCKEEHFHLPKYSRFYIMGSQGEPLEAHQEGLIRLQNPFFKYCPSQDLLTEDLGYWGTNCPCGEPLPYLHFLSRLSTLQGTCAFKALASSSS
jgi:hypothetical protein